MAMSESGSNPVTQIVADTPSAVMQPSSVINASTPVAVVPPPDSTTEDSPVVTVTTVETPVVSTESPATASTDSAVNTTLSTNELTSETKQKIVKQVEFYFSDANLRRDKFLIAQIGDDEHGFVKFDVLLTFPRLKALTTSVPALANALETSTLLKISEDRLKIARVSAFVRGTLSSTEARTVFVNHIPEASTIESVTELISLYGSVQLVRIPSSKGKHRHQLGFAFVEMDSEDSVAKAVEALPKKDKVEGETKREMYALNMAGWAERKLRKKSERKRKPKKGGGGVSSMCSDAVKVHIIGNLIRFDGVAPGFTKAEMGSALSGIATAKFIDHKAGSDYAILRFADADLAKSVVKHFDDNVVNLQDVPLKARVLTEHEQLAYWTDVHSSSKPHGRGQLSKREERKRKRDAKIAEECLLQQIEGDAKAAKILKTDSAANNGEDVSMTEKKVDVEKTGNQGLSTVGENVSVSPGDVAVTENVE